MNWWPISGQDADLEREIRSDLELKKEEQHETCMSPEGAPYAARRTLGKTPLNQVQVNKARGWEPFDRFLQDVQFSLRTIRRSPRVALTVLFTLMLGIGANTAIFSIVNAALLRPLPFSEPGELVQLRADLPGVGSRDIGFSYPEIEDIRDRSGIFQSVSVVWQSPSNLTGGDHPERLDILAVSSSYFTLLGSQAQLGRLFDSRDAADGFADAAVISDNLWQTDFGRDRNVIGRRLRLDNDLYTIVGVLPPSFRNPASATARPVDIWVTAGFRALPFPAPARIARFLPAIIARLKPGITIQQARSQLTIFTSSLRRENGGDYPAAADWKVSITPLRDIVVGNSRSLLLSLMFAVGFILLIACVNVANILLANASVRQREISVRMALGASRGRIVRQFLTESALLSLAAAAIGLGAAAAFLRFGMALLPSQLPHVNAITVDGRVLSFSLLISFCTTVLFGLIPAMRITKAEPNGDELRGRGSSASLRESRLGRILISTEVALSLMLLVSAGLMMRTFWELLRANPGFHSEHLLAANIWLPLPNDPTKDPYAQYDQRARLIQETLRRLRMIPGIEDAAISNFVPLQDSPLPVGFRTESNPERGDMPTAVRAFVTPDFFRTLGLPLMRGRSFQEYDTTKTPLVILVDEAAAHRFWGDRDPIGQRIRFSRDRVVNGKLVSSPWMQVIGVVANSKLTSLDEQNVPHIYGCMYQVNGKLFGVIVRATGDTAALGHAIQMQVQSIDPDLPVSKIAEMQQIISNKTGDRRFATWLIGAFAAVALLLTGVGIYGVSSYAVARRTKELGIRSALGASQVDLIRIVVVAGMLPVIAGVIAGGISAIYSTRLIATLLYSVKPMDPGVIGMAGAIVVFIGIAANYIPARRASKTNPIIALRID
jgi:putative ABC transport system permease protein